MREDGAASATLLDEEKQHVKKTMKMTRASPDLEAVMRRTGVSHNWRSHIAGA